MKDISDFCQKGLTNDFQANILTLQIWNKIHIHIIRRWLMPLVVAPVGKDVRVVKILADEKTKKHLENLGITIDSVIRVISASGGSVICVVKDGRLALDKEMATKILIA